MPAPPRSRWQSILVIALFAGSVGVLIFNAYSVLLPARREAAVRAELRQASARLADAAAEEVNAWGKRHEP